MIYLSYWFSCNKQKIIDAWKDSIFIVRASGLHDTCFIHDKLCENIQYSNNLHRNVQSIYVRPCFTKTTGLSACIIHKLSCFIRTNLLEILKSLDLLCAQPPSLRSSFSFYLPHHHGNTGIVNDINIDSMLQM